MTQEDEEDYRNNYICQFCEQNIESDKVGDHCDITGKYSGTARNKCNFIVIQDQSNFIRFIFHNFRNFVVFQFFKKVIDKRNDKVKFKIIPKLNEVYISVRHGCIRFIDSNRFLSSSLDSLAKTLVDISHKTLKNLEEEIVESYEILEIVKAIKKN